MAKKEKEEIKNYPVEVQEYYLNFLMSDPTAFTRCQSILKDTYWADKLRPAVRFIMKYADENHALPTPEEVKAQTHHQIEKMGGLLQAHSDSFLKEIEGFCRHRAIESVIFEGAELIQTGHYSEVEQRIRDAVTISLQRDLGTDYFADPKGRIQQLMDKSDMVATGWRDLDAKLYGGFTKGALNIFAGGSGSGKSLFLQNLALNWVFAGLHVIYISLELSENLVSTRLDAMVAGVSTKDVFKKIDDVDLKVRLQGKQSKGSLTVKKMPEAGTNANVIRAYLKEYEIQTGRKPDAILVDYMDLMYPNSSKIDPSNAFVKDKYVAEELRALMGEVDAIGASASQLNRGSIEAHEFDHSHIAGGISKINTADNVFAIFTSQPMRERGEYQIQFLKTRSSSAVGQRINLKFDINSLRIMDADPDEALTQTRSIQDITKAIKHQSKQEELAEAVSTPGTTWGAKPKEGFALGDAANTASTPPWMDASRGAANNAAQATASTPPQASVKKTQMMDLLKKVQRS